MTIIDQVYSEGEGDNQKQWFVTRLHEKAKDLPVEEMPLSGLNLVGLAPLRSTMKAFVVHVQAVQDADLSYPIILDHEGFVMDGRHRIAKALLQGDTSIKFVRFPDYIEPDIE